MISPREFVDILKAENFRDFTGVPCSFFQAATSRVIDDPATRYVIVPNEGSALALAAGFYLGGHPSVLMIQNSGFGNLVNPLTSLSMIYDIPVLVFMSGRAYGVLDEPQHEVMGKTMGAVLDALGVRHEDMPDQAAEFRASLGRARAWMDAKKQPFFYFVRKGTLDEYKPARAADQAYPLKRIDAVRIIAGALAGDELVIATTGKPSRELFSVADRRGNFYMQGSMGHAASIGLGTALARPDKKAVVIDGDGALLMHMGVLSSVGHYKPANFYHIVLDNESYETTGDQDTTSSTTDFAAAGRACGYRASEDARDEAGLKAALARMLRAPGPALLCVKINRVPTDGIPRISSKYDSPMIAANFRAAVAALTVPGTLGTGSK